MAETIAEQLAREELIRQAEGARPHRTFLGEEFVPPQAVEQPVTPASTALADLDRLMEASREASVPRFDTAFGSDATPAERALLELDRMISPTAPMQVGGIREGVGHLARTAANVVGTAAAPIIGPLTRPEAGTPEAVAFERGTGVQRLVDEVGRSQEAAQAFLRRFGIIPDNLPENPNTLLGHIGADLLPAAFAAIGVIKGAQFLSRYAGSDYLARLGLTAPASARAAPSTVPGLGPVGRLAAQIEARPVTFGATVVGSQPVATTTRELASPIGEAAFGPWQDATWGNWIGRGVWDFATEAIGGGMFAGLMTRFGRFPSRETYAGFDRPPTPILSAAADPATAAGTVRLQAVETIDTFDRMIASAIQHAGAPGVTPQTAGVRLHGSLIAARDFAREATVRAYSRVPDSLGNPSALIDEMTELMRIRSTQSGGLGQNVDMPYLGELQRQLYRKNADGSLYIGPTGNPQYRTDVSLREIQAIRSELLHRGDAAADSLRAGGQGRRTEKELLTRLHDAATTDIERWLVPGSPGFHNWQYANNLYRAFNDRFMRGPVERMLRTGPYAPMATAGVTLQPGQPHIPPIEMARELLKADDTAEAVFNASLRFGMAQNNTPVLRAASQAAAQGVRGSSEDAIGAMFRAELDDVWSSMQAQTAGRSRAPDVATTYNLEAAPATAVARRANQFMADNEHLLRSWTNVTADMWQTTTSLNRLMQARNEYTRGIVSQFIGRDIDTVIQEALDSPARVARFAELYSAMRHNPDALEGIRRAAINRLFHGVGADPNVALQRLQSRQYREALTALFKGDEDRLNRLYDMVRTATDITGREVIATGAGTVRLDEKGTVKSMGIFRRAARSASINMAGWFLGLIPGHLLTRMIPGMGSAASLSIPLRMSTTARNIVAAAWMRDRNHALSIVRDAVFDPNLESWLMMTGPGNWREMQQSFQTLSRNLRRAQLAANGDADSFLEGEWRAAAARDRRRHFDELARIRRGPFRGPE